MLQPKEKPKYPIYFYQHQSKKVLILDEVANMIIKDKNIVGWMVIVEVQIKKLNLGSEGDPKEVLINAVLPTSFQAKIKELLVSYCDDFKGIPKEICEQKID
jgi:hypothetical protein